MEKGGEVAKLPPPYPPEVGGGCPSLSLSHRRTQARTQLSEAGPTDDTGLFQP